MVANRRITLTTSLQLFSYLFIPLSRTHFRIPFGLEVIAKHLFTLCLSKLFLQFRGVGSIFWHVFCVKVKSVLRPSVFGHILGNIMVDVWGELFQILHNDALYASKGKEGQLPEDNLMLERKFFLLLPYGSLLLCFTLNTLCNCSLFTNSCWPWWRCPSCQLLTPTQIQKMLRQEDYSFPAKITSFCSAVWWWISSCLIMKPGVASWLDPPPAALFLV